MRDNLTFFLGRGNFIFDICRFQAAIGESATFFVLQEKGLGTRHLSMNAKTYRAQCDFALEYEFYLVQKEDEKKFRNILTQ